MGSKPSYLASGELVHSQTPPISLWPASLSPFAVTETGCQLLKPMLAPLRLAKSSCEPPPFDEDRDGGVSATPSLSKCLELCQSSSVFIMQYSTYPLTAGTVLARCFSASFCLRRSACLYMLRVSSSEGILPPIHLAQPASSS